MDACQLEFPDNTFDVVMAAYVITTVCDPHQVCREMLRVVKPGGQIIAINHTRCENGSRLGASKTSWPHFCAHRLYHRPGRHPGHERDRHGASSRRCAATSEYRPHHPGQQTGRNAAIGLPPRVPETPGPWPVNRGTSGSLPATMAAPRAAVSGPDPGPTSLAPHLPLIVE